LNPEQGKPGLLGGEEYPDASDFLLASRSEPLVSETNNGSIAFTIGDTMDGDEPSSSIGPSFTGDNEGEDVSK
jgi:hypothetical protein